MKTRLNRLKIQLEFSDRSAQERKLSLMVRENDSKRELYLAKKKNNTTEIFSNANSLM